jgi:O-methyltransferase domain/Dimerisation domain
MTQHEQPNNAKVPPLDAILMQMLFGALMQQSICVAAKLGIADLLAKRPQTAAELASTTETHEPSLYRILRTLASAGIFAENADRKFELTPIAQLLRSDAPNSMRDFAIMFGEEWMWQAWGALMHSVRTGEVAHVKVQGMGSFEFFEKNKEAGEIFNRAMTSNTLRVIPAIVEAYDFSGIGKLVDIAGGHGLLLAGILKAHPRMQGVLFDMRYVIEGAGKLLEKEGVSSRVELASGDFFESVPPGADAYTMKHIIHDWDDEHSIKILQNIRMAINKNGKVLIVEMVVPEGNEPSASKFLDIQMLVMETGRERTKDEYRRLLEASGFRLTRIIPTKSSYSVIEGEPV